MAESISATALANVPFLDTKTGRVSWTWIKILQQWQAQLAGGFDANGNLIGNIDPSVEIAGRDGTIGDILQNIDAEGVVEPTGMSSATDAAQGAVILPAGATSNTLGSAAMEPTTAFDPAGSAAAAQAAAETFATNAANTAQSNAEAAASAALAAALPPALSVTIITAALTPAGTQGSITVTNGRITAQVQAT